jgi:hypothetical protein
MRFSKKAVSLCAAMTAVSCQANWISPYDADVQKRATDMLADVTAFETTLAQTRDTSAADPTKPGMQTKLAGWVGQIEAMATVQDSINPTSPACDKALNSLAGNAIRAIETQAATTGAMTAAGAPPLVLTCESLPDVFAKMRSDLVQNIPHVLAGQCMSGQTPVQFAQRCQFLFKPDPLEGPEARHGLVFSSLITGLDIVIFREGKLAAKAKSS